LSLRCQEKRVFSTRLRFIELNKLLCNCKNCRNDAA